jgi:hypothetical protein
MKAAGLVSVIYTDSTDMQWPYAWRWENDGERVAYEELSNRMSE